MHWLILVLVAIIAGAAGAVVMALLLNKGRADRIAAAARERLGR